MSSDQQKHAVEQPANQTASDSIDQHLDIPKPNVQHITKNRNISFASTPSESLSSSPIYTGKVSTSSLRLLQQPNPPNKNSRKKSNFSVKGSKTNATKKISLPPLHKAAKQGSLEKVKEILNSEPNLLDSRAEADQATPLHYAVRGGHPAVVKYLLDKGVDVNLTDKTQKTPLHIAARSSVKGIVECVPLLLSVPTVDVNKADYSNRTPLHLCCAYGDVETIKKLLAHPKIDVNLKDIDRLTPLHVALRFHREDVAKILLEDERVKVNKVDKYGRAPLHLAAYAGLLASVELLLKRGANIEVTDENQNTALHLAAKEGKKDVVLCLIQHGANVSPVNDKGATPIQLAVRNEHDDIAQILVNNGADVSVRYDETIIKQRREKRLSRMREYRLSLHVSGSKQNSSGSSSETDTSDMKGSDSQSDPLKMSDEEKAQLELRAKVNRWGFIRADSSPSSPEDSPVDEATKKKRAKEEYNRAKKWVKMLKSWDNYYLNKYTKVRRRVWKGIPDRVRGVAWQCISGSQKLKNTAPHNYSYYLQLSVPSKITHQIDLDVNRSNRHHIDFKERFGIMQISLFNVLKAYAAYDSALGYCQGMSDITAFLLMYLPEEEAFWMLVQLFTNGKYKLRGHFLENFPGLKEAFSVVNNILATYFPKLQQHLEQENVSCSFYCTKWLLKLFLDSVTFDTALRIWDIFLFEGHDILYSVCYAIFRLNEAKLLSQPLDEIMPTLQNIWKHLPDAETFLHEVQRVRLKKNLIRKWEKDHRSYSHPK
jgi:ankyrin repeat protein